MCATLQTYTKGTARKHLKRYFSDFHELHCIKFKQWRFSFWATDHLPCPYQFSLSRCFVHCTVELSVLPLAQLVTQSQIPWSWDVVRGGTTSGWNNDGLSKHTCTLLRKSTSWVNFTWFHSLNKYLTNPTKRLSDCLWSRLWYSTTWPLSFYPHLLCFVGKALPLIAFS